MNPLGTFLRVLGTEPWQAVYLEPSVRADDSRYGDNPNRLACHHQIQVLVHSSSAADSLSAALLSCCHAGAQLSHVARVQVIMKPDPGNSQELYLGSLEALGISTRANDVRFVEDDWKSPALGANGLGWEVWLNGQVGPASAAKPDSTAAWPVAECIRQDSERRCSPQAGGRKSCLAYRRGCISG